MINNRSTIPTKWISNNDVKISMSLQHKDLYVVDHKNGTFHSINSSAETMISKYPIKFILIK